VDSFNAGLIANWMLVDILDRTVDNSEVQQARAAIPHQPSMAWLCSPPTCDQRSPNER